MLRTTYINLYSILYAFCLWAAVYFIENNSHVRMTVFGVNFTIGIIFLAWVSTFRDLAQMSGLRFRSLLVLLAVCIYLWIDLDGRIATAAVAALLWTEVLDFFIFTFIARRYRTLRGVLAAVVVSDVLTIPALWFFLLSFAGYGIDDLPEGTMTVQYLALLLLYCVLGAIFLHDQRWKRHFSVRKASD